MISSLRGPVLVAGPDFVVLEVGGVGLQVSVTPDFASSAAIGVTLFVHTTLVVREDSLSLYGFAEKEELEVFQLLLGVSGIGPRSALGVLGHLGVAQIADAVASEDDAPFRRVSGIGPKTAKLITVQLAGKLILTRRRDPASSAVGTVTQVAAALVGLGWSDRVATDAAQAATDAGGADEGVPALLRRALAVLGPAAKGGENG